MKKLLHGRKIKKWKKLIEKSELFDNKYYLFTYPDVRSNDINPIIHYLLYGANEGRNPNAEFNTTYYIQNNFDVAQSILHPFVHYILYGKDEGRLTKKITKLENNPLVSIVIPFKDKSELLTCVISSILDKSKYKNFEIIGISNNSIENETFQTMEYFKKLDNRIQFYNYDIPFNYSKINNYAVSNFAKGEYIVFMNNDIEIISPLWIEALLEQASKDEVGAVGAKLYYEDDTIQHAGVSLNANHAPVHIFHKMKRESNEKSLNVVKQYLAVSAALMMVSREKYTLVNAFDESLAIAYNDVDLCFKLMKKGYKNLFTPHCEAYHYKSLSRGYENTPEKQKRLSTEKIILMNKHADILMVSDPFMENHKEAYRMKKILFVSATGRVDRPYLDPSVRYRCYNPAMLLQKKGYLVDVVSFKNFDIETIQRYDFFIFHRPQFGKKLTDAILMIQKQNATMYADYDDLIFSQKYALESSIYKTNRASVEECLSIFKHNQEAMLQFNNFTVSTEPLKTKILEIHPKANVHVIENALSLDTIHRIHSQKHLHKKIDSNKKIISYLSGTKSHDTDFLIVENVLASLLKKYKGKIEIQLVGPLDYNKEKLPSALHIPYVDYEYLSKLIAKTHINIAPLEMNNFTNCKSGLKFFESGILSIPSVVTPIYDMLRFSDSDGIIYANNSTDWFNAIEKLIIDDNYYEQKSKKTYEYVLKRCTMKNVISKYVTLLEKAV